jgi:DNA-binding transcriptional MerR regulator
MSGNLAVMPIAEDGKSGALQGAIAIPSKLYFRIGEVAEICQLPAYVLRYWETEFRQLRPPKGSTGQRMYRRRDVETLLQIKHLLYEEGYTIAGAKERLKARPAAVAPAATVEAPVALRVETPAPTPLFATETLPFAAEAENPKAESSALHALRQQLTDLRHLLDHEAGQH